MKPGQVTRMGIAAILLMSGAFSVMAGEPPKMTPEQQAAMAQAMQRGTPGEAHKALEPIVGKWTSSVHYWMKPGDKPQESTGTNENSWILGGRFVKQDYHGTMGNGQSFEGLGITGYDNIRAEYQTLWLDNMMTGMMYGTGTLDGASKTLKVSGTFSCPMTGEKAMWYRSELKIKDNDHHTYYSYGKTPDGKEFRNMEINYTRAK